VDIHGFRRGPQSVHELLGNAHEGILGGWCERRLLNPRLLLVRPTSSRLRRPGRAWSRFGGQLGGCVAPEGRQLPRPPYKRFRRPSRVSLRPELVDAQGGPMSLAVDTWIRALPLSWIRRAPGSEFLGLGQREARGLGSRLSHQARGRPREVECLGRRLFLPRRT
jgi:hypothetical protein